MSLSEQTAADRRCTVLLHDFIYPLLVGILLVLFKDWYNKQK